MSTLANYDDAILFYSLGVLKPFRTSLEKASWQAGATPGRCFFADARQANGDAARGAGVKDVRFESVRGLDSDVETTGPLCPCPSRGRSEGRER